MGESPESNAALPPTRQPANPRTIVCDACSHPNFCPHPNTAQFGKSSNWAKFSATASIGVVHRPKGLLSQSQEVLEAYLPRPGGNSSPYSEGGALYALGLIHAAKAGDSEEGVIPYLLETLSNAGPNEPLQHGGCLAVGLSAMGTADKQMYEVLKNILFNDSAIGGEAAAYGIGLLLLGQSRPDGWTAEALTELLAYAHDTQHEKIIRALGIAAALASYGREEAAETLIETLARDRDAIIRYGAMYTIGLAYAGTGANGAVRRLLHVAVSDVSDDVVRTPAPPPPLLITCMCSRPQACMHRHTRARPYTYGHAHTHAPPSPPYSVARR